MKKYTTQSSQLEFDFPDEGPNPSGYCMCGCGQKTKIAKQTDSREKCVKGKPKRFIVGHYAKTRPIIPARERFWASVDRSGGPGSCWLWTKKRNDSGYGIIQVDGRHMRAHRFSWELHFGPIPEHNSYHGMCVLHECDNPACVNPAHLFLGTNRDNVDDMVAKGRQHHGNGLRGELHPNAKLTTSVVMEIRSRRASGESAKKLAAEFRIMEGTVRDIVRRKSWKWLE